MKTSKIIKERSVPSFWDEGRYVDWLQRHGKSVLTALGCIAILLLIALKFSSGNSAKKSAEYLTAQKAFIEFQRGEDVESLELQMQQLPVLDEKYGSFVAQTLLNRGKEAKSFADKALQRVNQNDLPFYSDYARASLLISEGSYKEALEKTIQLKQKMLEHQGVRQFGDSLFAFTLLRQALLHQKLGNASEEIASWNELQQYAGLVDEAPANDSFSSESFLAMLAQFEEGKISFNDYIEYRKTCRGV